MNGQMDHSHKNNTFHLNKFWRGKGDIILEINAIIKQKGPWPGPWVAHLRMTDQWSGTICEILVECIMINNFVKLY